MVTISLEISGDTPSGVSLIDLTRLDTNGAVDGVTLPAAFTLVNGSWVFSFAEPAEGLEYAYAYRITWPDGSTNDDSGTVTGSPATTYSTDADLYNESGDTSVDVYADLNNNGDAGEIAARKAWARAKAYRWINSKLRGAELVAPATADNFSEFELLRDVEAERAVAILYFGRGKSEQQQPDGMDGAMQVHYDHAEKELDRLIGVVEVNATETSGGIDGISVIGPATNGACCGSLGCGVIL